MTRSRRHSVLALVAALVSAAPALAQTGVTVSLRGAALGDALQVFVERTGRSVAYDPDLVAGRRTWCVTTERDPDRMLACILDGTGLEFFRRASGTYVVGPMLELPARYGLITGRVVDAETAAPLAGAHVLLATAGRGAAADPSGRFAIDRLLPGRYALTVTHVGYRPWIDSLTVEPDGRTSLRAALDAEWLAVEPIVVESDLAAADPWQAGTDPSEARGRGAPGAVPIADRLAGRSGVTLSDVTADIRLQGGTAGDVALRLDGVPLLLPRSLAAFVGPLGASAVDRIDVRRAGFEAGAGSFLGGVLDFRHAIDGPGTLDLQVDPYAVSGRGRVGVPMRGGRQLQVLASVRLDMDASLRPGAIDRMLREWSAPDPFLLVAPLRRYELATPEALGTIFGVEATGEPTLSYGDLHLAARFRSRPTTSWDASVHRGTRSLAGSRLSPGRFADVSSESPLFSSTDAYDWQSTMGQLRYETVLGTRTFVSAQGWTSRYRMEHGYRLAEQVGSISFESALDARGVSTDAARDLNRVSALGLTGSLSTVRGRHQVEAGFETRTTTSRFDLRLASIAAGTLTETVVYRPSPENGALVADTSAVFAVRHARVSNRADQFRASLHASDRLSLGRLLIEPGIRLTLLPDRATVYAEPRLRAAYAWPETSFGSVQATLASGLYRQFDNQLDVSTLNAGAFFPSTRIWLPLDGTLRPPQAVHLGTGLTWRPDRTWTASLDGWWKRVVHGLEFDYGLASTLLQDGARLAQEDLLTPVDGTDLGVGVAGAYRSPVLWASLRYERSRSNRSGPDLFGGRSVPGPGHAPHRLSGSVDWSVRPGLEVGVRGEAAWGRTWAFRRAYYDYFGHDPGTAAHGGFDLSDPGAHRLPLLADMDVSAAWTLPVDAFQIHVRAEVRNVLDRANVADRQLLWDGSALSPVARHFSGRVGAVAIRLVW